MKYNLYSLNENQLKDFCSEKLLDKKSTEIVIKKIIYGFSISAIANDLNMTPQAIYRRISKVKAKFNIHKWTDSIV